MMRVCFHLVRGAALLAVMSGCSSGTSSNGSAPNASAFAGVWRCVKTGQSTSASPWTLELADNGNGTVAMVSRTDGGAPCSINFTVTGATASVMANQRCTRGGLIEYTMACSAGTLTLSGNTLETNLTVTVTVSGMDAGTMTMHPTSVTESAQSTCTQQ
jgi:hypothetical protein